MSPYQIDLHDIRPIIITWRSFLVVRLVLGCHLHESLIFLTFGSQAFIDLLFSDTSFVFDRLSELIVVRLSIEYCDHSVDRLEFLWPCDLAQAVDFGPDVVGFGSCEFTHCWPFDARRPCRRNQFDGVFNAHGLDTPYRGRADDRRSIPTCSRHAYTKRQNRFRRWLTR